MWPNGLRCPVCGLGERITTRKGGFYRCNQCNEDFTVRTGTIFERSHIPLHKWLYAMYLLVTARKGISSMQLGKEIGITQKSAWFMLRGSARLAATTLSKLQRHRRNRRDVHRRQGSQQARAQEAASWARHGRQDCRARHAGARRAHQGAGRLTATDARRSAADDPRERRSRFDDPHRRARRLSRPWRCVQSRDHQSQRGRVRPRRRDDQQHRKRLGGAEARPATASITTPARSTLTATLTSSLSA